MIDPLEWTVSDPEVAAGGNGMLYFVGLDNGLLFTHTADQGFSFGGGSSFQGRPLKHICIADEYGPDRPGVLGDPYEASEKLFVYWNNGHNEIRLVTSTNAGDDFSGDGDAPFLLDDKISDPTYQLYSPSGAMSMDGTLYVAWTEWRPTFPAPDTRILMRRLDNLGWFPALGPGTEPHTIAELFRGFFATGGPSGIGAARSAPSIAVDCSGGPYDGWVYVVYADRGDPFGEPTPIPSRVKFVRSCDNGQTWSQPCSITSCPGCGAGTAQVYPRIKVDGRGNIGVSWYDTRFWEPPLPGNALYDIYFAFSSDGGTTWSEKRVTEPAEDGYPIFQADNADDYSGMTADPRLGESRFHVLAMGALRVEDPTDVDIYSFEIKLRTAGDGDADYDVDLNDFGGFQDCFTGNSALSDPCVCALFDFDDDGDVDLADYGAFYAKFTGQTCACALDCQGCASGESGAGPSEPTAPPLGTEGLPEGCERAVPLLTRAPAETVASFAETLRNYVETYPDASDRSEIEQFLQCLYAVLP